MKGSAKSRRDKGKGRGLRFRCARCKVLRKHDEMDTGQGGEEHASPSPNYEKGEGLVCGWCILRAQGVETFTGTRDNGKKVTRDVKTGRVIKD